MPTILFFIAVICSMISQTPELIAMKADAAEETAEAQGASKKLGGKLIEVRRFTLPDSSARSLIFVEKIRCIIC